MRHSGLTLRALIGLAAGLPIACAPAELPRLDELEPGWHRLFPGGEATCALGDEYSFFARPGATDRLLVYFDGGGGCWSAETCEPTENANYTDEVEDQLPPERRLGIFDLQNPENPLSEFSMVIVPYCTADSHLGTRVHEYQAPESDEPIVIRHVGHVNATAVLQWVEANFTASATATILVAGLSAGAVATPFYADVLARRFPDARVIGIADGSGAWGSGMTPDLDPFVWNLEGTFESEKRWSELAPSSFGTETFFQTAASEPGDPELFQIDHAYDGRQVFHFMRAGTSAPDILELLDRSRASVLAKDEDFRSYTPGGIPHGTLAGPFFYLLREGEVRLVDWVGRIVRGEPVETVRCTACERAHFTFAPSDLEHLDRALELLSSESQWDANPGQRSCSSSADKRTVWCALVEAARQLDLGNPVVLGSTAEVVTLASLRLGDWQLQRPLSRYNDFEGRTFEEVRSLLLDARETIARDLEP